MPKNNRRVWTSGDIKILHANAHIGAVALADRLGRTHRGVRDKASQLGISLKRPSKPAENAHPLVKALSVEMDRKRETTDAVSARSGIAARTIEKWRQGSSPNLFLFVAVANTVGLDLRLVDLESAR